MPVFIDGSTLHPSTRLALSGLEWLEERISPARVLDVGCGNGILSLTAHHLWRVPVLACDISQQALHDLRDNLARFAPEANITPLRSDKLKHPHIRESRPYGLIIANMLAQWQVEMARELAELLEPGGVLLLSGILLWQLDGAAEAFSHAGFNIKQQISEGEWQALLLARATVT